MSHMFKIGDFVRLEVEAGQARQPGSYIVEAQMPPVGSALQYRIKSTDEGFRRVVVEHRLRAAGAEMASNLSASANAAFSPRVYEAG